MHDGFVEQETERLPTRPLVSSPVWHAMFYPFRFWFVFCVSLFVRPYSMNILTVVDSRTAVPCFACV